MTLMAWLVAAIAVWLIFGWVLGAVRFLFRLLMIVVVLLVVASIYVRVKGSGSGSGA